MSVVEFRFSLEFLTPAFIGGAYPETNAEFSLKALKSTMRYWWRMAQDWANTSQMFEREKLVFGYTKRASPFRLRILDRSGLSIVRVPNSYLFFSCLGQGSKKEGREEWIHQGSSVKLSICFYTDDTTLISEAILSLWLAQTFGGLGSRSRRGGGSFVISVEQTQGDWNFVRELFNLTASQFANQLNDNTKNWYASLVNRNSPLAVALRTRDHFKKTRSFPSANDLLDRIGSTMRNYRAVFRSGGRAFKNDANDLHYFAISGRRTPYSGRDPLPKHAFGLPIIYNFRRRGGGGFESKYIEAVPKDFERRASPLFISVKRHARGNYYANLLLLWHNFLPNGKNILLNVRQRRSSGPPIKSTTVNPPANPDAIITFMRSVP